MKGTGVGLTFVKKIIERHHGRIWVEFTPRRGIDLLFHAQHRAGGIAP